MSNRIPEYPGEAMDRKPDTLVHDRLLDELLDGCRCSVTHQLDAQKVKYQLARAYRLGWVNHIDAMQGALNQIEKLHCPVRLPEHGATPAELQQLSKTLGAERTGSKGE